MAALVMRKLVLCQRLSQGFAASAAPPTHLPTHPASAAAHPAHRTCLPYDENPTRA